MKLKIVDFKVCKSLWSNDAESWLFSVGGGYVTIPPSEKGNKLLAEVYMYYKDNPSLFVLECGSDIYDLLREAELITACLPGVQQYKYIDNFQEAVDYAVSRWQNK